MNLYIKHIILPAVAPALIVALYYTPVTVFGCRNRGLIAASIALTSAICAFIAIGFAFSAQRKHEPVSKWWILSTIIFTLPLVLLLGPLG
ncbi:MAG TPA: hypothetical protein VHO84_03370 [Syntrophorhabdaceae bacterium]|nr:hypothetical protein [Syntrophorhabdaceae bacterium]